MSSPEIKSDLKSCTTYLCNNKIYNASSFRNALLDTKKKLGPGFESKSAYKQLTVCKPSENSMYLDMAKCLAYTKKHDAAKKRTTKKAPSPKTATPPKPPKSPSPDDPISLEIKQLLKEKNAILRAESVINSDIWLFEKRLKEISREKKSYKSKIDELKIALDLALEDEEEFIQSLHKHAREKYVANFQKLKDEFAQRLNKILAEEQKLTDEQSRLLIKTEELKEVRTNNKEKLAVLNNKIKELEDTLKREKKEQEKREKQKHETQEEREAREKEEEREKQEQEQKEKRRQEFLQQAKEYFQKAAEEHIERKKQEDKEKRERKKQENKEKAQQEKAKQENPQQEQRTPENPKDESAFEWPLNKSCPKGSRRNKKTNLCERQQENTKAKAESEKAAPAKAAPEKAASEKAAQEKSQKQPFEWPSNKKCPNGTRRNKTTNLCEYK
jgi:hypothetical protein